MSLYKTCNICAKEYEKPLLRGIVSWKKSKYCSMDCLHRSRVGFKLPVPWKEKIRKSHKGKTPVNLSLLHSAKIREKVKPLISGMNNYAWKGNEVGYRALHHWVNRHLGRPSTCEFCKKTNLEGKRIHWANKSHQYKRVLSDWLRLCVKCHHLYDKQK